MTELFSFIENRIVNSIYRSFNRSRQLCAQMFLAKMLMEYRGTTAPFGTLVFFLEKLRHQTLPHGHFEF